MTPSAATPSSAEEALFAQNDEGQWRAAKSLLAYLWPDGRTDLKLRVILAILFLILAKITTVLTPFALKEAVDALAPPLHADADAPSRSSLAWLAAASPASLLVAYGTGRVGMVLWAQARDALFAKVGQNAVRDISIATFERMHALSLRFHLERRTGGLSRVIERGTKGIEIVLRYMLFNIIPTLLETLLVYVIILLMFGADYATAAGLSVLAYVGFTYVATAWRIAIRRDMNAADVRANSKAVDSLLNYETVKHFTNEAHETRRFDRSMERYERAAVKTLTSLSALNSGQAIIYTFGLTCCLLFAADDIADGNLTLGEFVFINALLVQLYMPLNFLGSTYRDIKQGLVDTEAMFALHDVAVEVRDPPDAPPLAVRDGGGEIEFRDVVFGYDAERPILRSLSLRVPPGKKVAVVGPSGAGKSTISRLLYRFYDVGGGAILIDGQNIAECSQDSVRSAIGIVPQDAVLFNDSVRYNIAYGRPDASDDEIESAARQAQIHDFVTSLPDGYDTQVGERGLKLSGGEKQRVAIARTLLKRPPILMLDEATSALDSATERDIQDALNAASANRTALVIAHRLSTVVDADEIVVLSAGEIVERGSHGELISAGGVYADMWARQREVDEAETILRRRALEEAHA